MHDIEPFFRWRRKYVSSEDPKSPFYGQGYDEFRYTKKIYNYYIHPQWDFFGSHTLFMKILFIDYEIGFACIELMGEWNDCLHNDIMYLKREIADLLLEENVTKFILCCDNVLNFHGSDDCYYEEWRDDLIDSQGWVCCINTFDHVLNEMESFKLQHFIQIGDNFNHIMWRKLEPEALFQLICSIQKEITSQISN